MIYSANSLSLVTATQEGLRKHLVIKLNLLELLINYIAIPRKVTLNSIANSFFVFSPCKKRNSYILRIRETRLH